MFKKQKAPKVSLDLLRSIPLFEGVPDPTLERLAGHLDVVEVPAGQRVLTEGTNARRAFIIAEGTAQVRVDHKLVGEASAGDLIGEIAVLEGSKRTATMTAVTPMKLLSVDAEDIRWLFVDETLSDRVKESLARHLGGPQSGR